MELARSISTDICPYEKNRCYSIQSSNRDISSDLARHEISFNPRENLSSQSKNNVDDTSDCLNRNQILSECKPLRIMTWNINGLGDKIGEEDIQDMIKATDICVFLESKKGPDFVAEIPGYICKNFSRNKPVKNRNHYAGGILIFVSEINKSLVQFDSVSEHIVWVTIKSGVILPTLPLHIGFVYIPPINSSGNDKSIDYYDTLYNEIAIRRATGQVALCGDFNGRTSNIVGYVKDTNDTEFCYDSINNTFNTLGYRTKNDKSSSNTNFDHCY